MQDKMLHEPEILKHMTNYFIIPGLAGVPSDVWAPTGHFWNLQGLAARRTIRAYRSGSSLVSFRWCQSGWVVGEAYVPFALSKQVDWCWRRTARNLTLAVFCISPAWPLCNNQIVLQRHIRWCLELSTCLHQTAADSLGSSSRIFLAKYEFSWALNCRPLLLLFREKSHSKQWSHDCTSSWKIVSQLITMLELQTNWFVLVRFFIWRIEHLQSSRQSYTKQRSHTI